MCPLYGLSIMRVMMDTKTSGRAQNTVLFLYLSQNVRIVGGNFYIMQPLLGV